MLDLRLDDDEEIILQTANIWGYDGDEELSIRNMYLSNKNLIYTHEEFKGFFSKSEMIVDKDALKDVRVVDGIVQVEKIDDEDYGETLQILYRNGKRLLFELDDNKEYQKWKSAISKVAIDCREKEKAEEKKEYVPKEPNVKTTEKAGEQKPEKHTVSGREEEQNVVFCSNCGCKNNADARFCQSCGVLMGTVNRSVERFENDDITYQKDKSIEDNPKPEQGQSSTYYERKQEFVGKICKCPNCGEIITSFTAICPACGHEINMQKVSAPFKEFIDLINEYDKIISNNTEPTRGGWKYWGKGKKVGWIVLNVFTSFIPLVIYLTLPLIRPFVLSRGIPKLSPKEREKATLIENYAFPNEREAIAEAMMFTKSKISFLISEGVDKKTLYWINLWETKAGQLKQRADIILKDDKIIQSTYAEIRESRDIIYKKAKIRAAIGCFIIIAFLIFIRFIGSPFIIMKKIFPEFEHTITMQNAETEEKEIKESVKSDFEWLESGLFTKIPRIDAGEGKIHSNDDAKLWFDIDGVSYNEIEKYIISCKEAGYTVDGVKNTHTYTAYNEEGYRLEIRNLGDTMRIELKAPQTGTADYKWPENALAQRIPYMKSESGATGADEDEKCEIFLYGVSGEKFDAYIKLCEGAGYTIDCEKSDKEYSGFNDQGYKISVSLDDMKKMDIILEAPMIMSEVNWSTVVGVAEMLPKPESKIGKITSNYDWSFTIYIGDTTIDGYNDYVDECIKNGFDKDTYRSDTYFSAKNKKRDNLTAEYAGFNIIRISIYNANRL